MNRTSHHRAPHRNRDRYNATAHGPTWWCLGSEPDFLPVTRRRTRLLTGWRVLVAIAIVIGLIAPFVTIALTH